MSKRTNISVSSSYITSFSRILYLFDFETSINTNFHNLFLSTNKVLPSYPRLSLADHFSKSSSALSVEPPTAPDSLDARSRVERLISSRFRTTSYDFYERNPTYLFPIETCLRRDGKLSLY